MRLKNIKLQVVVSGVPGYFKLRSKHDNLFRETGLMLRDSIKFIESKLPGNVEIHGLFNAYTEENMARRAASKSIDISFQEIFDNGIHADSGGLQMVTLGKGEVTAEDRLKIYNTQASYADYAMSFDEIPSVVDKETETKYYLPDKIKSAGIRSGEYLKEQIDFFKTNGTNTKIIPISQGWGIEDTEIFAEGLFAKLSKKEISELSVLASGFPTTSNFVSAKRFYDITQAKNIPQNVKKHIHLLGVTGFKRLIPIIQLIKQGFAPDLKVLSFDSVTIAMSYVMGGIIPSIEDLKNKAPKLKLGKTRNKQVDTYWNEILEFWKDDPNNPFDDLDDLMEHSYYNKDGRTSGYQQYEYYIENKEPDKALFHFKKVLKQEQYYILYNLYKYITILEEFLIGNIELEHIFKSKDLTLFQALSSIKNTDDFDAWFEYVQKTANVHIPIKNSTEIQTSQDVTNLLF